VLQESEKELTMTVTSGLKCLESSKNPDQDGLLERMFLGSSIWHSTMCKLTWKENITKSGNSYYRLLPSMRTTEETASSLLPTPTAQQYGTSQNGKRIGRDNLQAGRQAITPHDGPSQSMANSYGEGLEIGQGFREHTQSELSTIERSGCEDRAVWSPEPCVGRVADGVPNRVDRIKGLGNAVVPQLIQAIGELVIKADREMRSGR
jgi:hypothetical protein